MVLCNVTKQAVKVVTINLEQEGKIHMYPSKLNPDTCFLKI